MRIILMEGGVETLEYFSYQLAEEYRRQGHEIFFWNLKKPAESRAAFEMWVDPTKETMLLTFNFIGLSGESQVQVGERSLWEEYAFPCKCIMVDHPLYYYRQLHAGIPNLSLVCIDRDHLAYVSKYYPWYEVKFVPLAGNEWVDTGKLGEMMKREEAKHYASRDIDLVFTGNYVALENLSRHTRHLTQEYKDFYQRTIERFLNHPDLELIQGLDLAIGSEMEDVTNAEERLQAHFAMMYVDLYVRSWYRVRTICSLADAGHKVFCVGKDWEKADCRHPENISCTGEVMSRDCMAYMERSKIALNVMPWFKNGAHDRIFTGMLSGCAVVSDGSHYLDEILSDGVDYLRYDLKKPESVIACVEKLKSNPAMASCMIANGQEKARKLHTWKERANQYLVNM